MPKTAPIRIEVEKMEETPYEEVRALIWGTVFKAMSMTAESLLPEMPFKEAVDMIVFFNKVFNAHLAKRPINQQQLADELGVSRNAVRARLEVLEKRGIIDGGWQRGANPIRISKAVLASPESMKRIQRLWQLFVDLGVELSKYKVEV